MYSKKIPLSLFPRLWGGCCRIESELAGEPYSSWEYLKFVLRQHRRPRRGINLLGRFVDHVTDAIQGPWLRALRPSLHPAGTSLLRTFIGHTGSIWAVALSADSRLAVWGRRTTP